MTFTGLLDADFDAYQPRKWQSHLYNRERLEVKQKLLALANELGDIAGTDGQPLAAEASVEHPALWNHKKVEAQHLFFTRGEAARKELELLIDKGRSLAALIDDPTPHRKHALLALTIDHERVEMAIKLHADARVDRQNLERKCADFFQRERLLYLLRSLPEGCRAGVVGGTTLAPGELDDDRLRALLGEFAASSSWLFAGRSLGRGEPQARGRALVEALREALARLGEIYRFVAWTRENDFLAVREQLKKADVARRAHGVAAGDRVRIVKGLLAGKAGVVQKVEKSGALRVRLGSMLATVDGVDVAKV